MIRHRFIRCADNEIHVRECGSRERPVVLMLHGFSQNGGAFLSLMRAMASTHCIIAPDMPGRGLSAWAAVPAEEYAFDRFAAIVMELLQQLEIERLSIVGTSMGGSLGMRLAAGPLAGRVQALVLNDIGIELPAGAVDAILGERSLDPTFESFAEFRAYLTDVYVRLSNAELSESQWTEFCLVSSRRTDDGRYTIHHDPGIFAQFEKSPGDFAVRSDFERLSCPVTLLHAGRSGVLPTEQVERMLALLPQLVVHRFASRGHALFLAQPDEMDAVRRSLSGP